MEETAKQFERKCRRWIRTHSEEVIKELHLAGRLPRCRCYDSLIEEVEETAPYVVEETTLYDDEL